MHWLMILAAGLAAGAINSVAGGGSFLTFPTLLFAGLPAVAANASSTVALVPSAASSGYGYRRELRALERANLKLWFAICIVGGLVGAYLLLITSDRTFRQIAPWLLLLATLLFAFGTRISLALKGRLHGNQWLMITLLLPISVYGGYFGGGIGIMILAALRLYGMSDIHGMNGLKALLAGTLNLVASFLFISAHQIWWLETLAMMAAGIAGGYIGPILARRVKPAYIRVIVICVGAGMTAYFFKIAPH